MIAYRLSEGSPDLQETPGRGLAGSWLVADYRTADTCLTCQHRRIPIVGSAFCDFSCRATVINLQKLKETLYETHPSNGKICNESAEPRQLQPRGVIQNFLTGSRGTPEAD